MGVRDTFAKCLSAKGLDALNCLVLRHGEQVAETRIRDLEAKHGSYDMEEPLIAMVENETKPSAVATLQPVPKPTSLMHLPREQPAEVVRPSKPINWFDGLYEHPGLKASDVLVGSYLFRRAMGKGWPVCWPGQDAIAKACRLDRKTVSSALRRLEARKMIESRQRRRARGRGQFSSLSNEYHLLPRAGWITITETPLRRRKQAEATAVVSALLPAEVKGADSPSLNGWPGPEEPAPFPKQWGIGSKQAGIRLKQVVPIGLPYCE
jgi:hypothetical protein